MADKKVELGFPLDRLTWDSDLSGIVSDGCTSDYILHEGLRVIPVMGPEDTPPVIVRIHAPYTERKLNYQYARNKTPPLIPTPGDTQTGYTYLGGDIRLTSPTQDASGYLVYSASGSYNFVAPKDVRLVGQMPFDGHGYLSLVDFLGNWNINPRRLSPGETDDVWQKPFYDLNLLASARILG